MQGLDASNIEICVSYGDSPLLGSLMLQRPGPSRDLREQIDRLTRKKTDRALVPLVAGPFRLIAPRARLEAHGLEVAEVIEALRAGLDVVQVSEPQQAGDGKSIVGLIRIRGSSWSARLSCPRARRIAWDWEVTSFTDDSPDRPPARLEGEWIPEDPAVTREIGEDALRLVQGVAEADRIRQAALAARRDDEVELGEIGLSISRTLRDREPDWEFVVDLLADGTTEILACGMPPNNLPGKPPGLTVWIPEAGRLATFRSAIYDGAGPNDLLLHSLMDVGSRRIDPIARVNASWQVNRTVGRRESTWRDQIQALLDQRARLFAAPDLLRDVGPFRVKLSNWARDHLSREGLTLADICAALNSGVYAAPVRTRYNRDGIRVWTEGSRRFYELTPVGGDSSHRNGPGDWFLTNLSPQRGESPQSFARLNAPWFEARREADCRAAGDREQTIEELSVLFEEGKRTDAEINECRMRLAGYSPKVVEKARLWMHVTELEREKYELGVAWLREHETEDGIFLLKVLNQQKLSEEIARIREEESEGQSWERHPLELYHDSGKNDQRESLRIAEDNIWDAAELKVQSHRPERLASLQRVARKWDPRPQVQPESPGSESPTSEAIDPAAIPEIEGPQGVRLYISNTEWNRVREALNVFNPEKDAERAQRIRPENALAPSHLPLNTLRCILTDPFELLAPSEPPELRWEPALGDRLSPAQRRAVAMAVSGVDITLIHGPPGTGKSTVIVEIIRQLFLRFGKDPNFRVLLVAPTHVAIDNVLSRLLIGEKCLATELGVTPYRLGSTKRVSEHLREHLHDCFHSSFLQDLSQKVDASLKEFEYSWDREQRLQRYLDRGAEHDLEAWSKIREVGGAWPDVARSPIPEGLTEEEENDARTQDGRLRLWKDRVATRTAKPHELLELLRDWKNFIEHNQEFFNELQAASANLLCATTVGCSTTPLLRGATYNYVIVDEAGKEESRKLLVALLRGEHWILVGDPKQLPPFADDTLKKRVEAAGLPTDLLTRSLFDELQPALEQRGRYVFLDHQGRMHPEISEFVSTFYESPLLNFPNTKDHIVDGPSWLPARPALQVLDTRHLAGRGEKVWENAEKTDKKIWNPLEYRLAVRLALAFTACPDWGDHTIGIIAPYGLQTRKILRCVEKYPRLAALLKKGALKVGTVDSFQGEERDVIIFSCTRSNPEGHVGFVDNLQRLNVALSRAKARLLVIADGRTVELSTRRDNLGEAEADVRSGLKRLFDHVRTKGGLIQVPADWRRIGRGPNKGNA